MIALLFLVYTGADLALPQYVCSGEEFANLSFQTRKAPTPAERINASSNLVSDIARDSHDSEAPEQEPCEEDCFCCCSHILPGLNLAQFGNSDIRTPRLVAQDDQLLSPPLQSTYHPPRFDSIAVRPGC